MDGAWVSSRPSSPNTSFSVVSHAVASLAPGRVPPLDAPATPEAILRAADAVRTGGGRGREGQGNS